jgi:CHAD domain-containing protein
MDECMAYRFKRSDATIGDGVRRIAREEIEAMFGILEGSEQDKVVHGVRRRCKRLRGLLRLVRPMFKKARKEDAAVRDAARLLSGARDADVMGETVLALAQKTNLLTAAQAEALAARLRRRQDAPVPDLARFRTELAEIHARISGWDVRGDGFAALEDGFADTYRRMRREMKAAFKSGQAEDFHAWRKRVKYHWHHLGLLREAAPELAEARREQASALGEVLGEHHNLHVLCGHLETGFADLAEAGAAAALSAARVRQAEYEAEARAIGDELCAEKPKALTRRLGAQWAEWAN